MVDRGLLAPWVEHPDTAAIVSDFDGTLSAIVDDPDEAQPLDGVVDALRVLADRYARVAIVSGRPIQFLLDHFGDLQKVTLAGLYGLQRVVLGRPHHLPEAERWRPVVAGAVARAAAEAPPGVVVEDKGLAATLHYRLAPEHQDWAQRFAAELSASTTLEALFGRKSVEFRPPVHTDKGTVVADLAAGMTAVCFVGDDVGDLPAFATLARLRAEGVATLAVAAVSLEAPADLLAAADVRVEGPPGALEFLRALAPE
ncbi:MAG: trehalose-phosphatase [Acidimicrobiaceae bacterium]|nr:trehalose-phosphatase [Acidimicrobiaceae bacterium]